MTPEKQTTYLRGDQMANKLVFLFITNYVILDIESTCFVKSNIQMIFLRINLIHLTLMHNVVVDSNQQCLGYQSLQLKSFLLIQTLKMVVIGCSQGGQTNPITIQLHIGYKLLENKVMLFLFRINCASCTFSCQKLGVIFLVCFKRQLLFSSVRISLPPGGCVSENSRINDKLMKTNYQNVKVTQ